MLFAIILFFFISIFFKAWNTYTHEQSGKFNTIILRVYKVFNWEPVQFRSLPTPLYLGLAAWPSTIFLLHYYRQNRKLYPKWRPQWTSLVLGPSLGPSPSPVVAHKNYEWLIRIGFDQKVLTRDGSQNERWRNPQPY